VFAIDDETFANVVRTARFFLQKSATPFGQPVPLEVLDAAVVKAVQQLLEDNPSAERDLYANEASRQIADGMRVQIADEKILVDYPHLDWYVGDRRKTRPLWDRYRRLLAHELRFNDTSIASVDRASDRIIEQLGEPSSHNSFDRRGLVVGQVQSGKTTSYAALINKAVDAGYQVVVVLTGVHESLRVQTQKRLEECVRGIATESGKLVGPPKGALLPLAQIHALASPPHLFTTRAVGGDFSSKASSFAVPVTGTHMFVVKKNVTILGELAKHFQDQAYRRQQNLATGGTEIIGRALLVIDDEADNASVDVNRPEPGNKDHDPTAINRAIRRLLVQFRQRAYVGYTATPYANVLIHKDNETSSVGPDLFPQDFIVMLPAPSNYVGPAAFFGGTTTDADAGSQATPPLLRFVSDCGCSGEPDDWMPRGHKKHHVPVMKGSQVIPASLRDAVMAFIVAAAVRRLRGWEKSHNSMLVHVSRFKQVQQCVREAIGTFVYELKGALADEESSSDLVSRFSELFEKDFLSTSAMMDPRERGHMPTLPEVKAEARDLLDLVKVLTVNSEAATSLDYDQYPSGLNVICVGGDKLSRGLTLEGLTVSYFLRASRMYDTLMQMGRWFGYRPGYKDLCRLYLTKELGRWYQHVARADEELRGEFLTLQDERRKPSDFGLRVRSHPSLLVTAPGKMASAEEFKLNFGGRVSQTIHFFRDPESLNHNAKVTCEFLDAIAEYADVAHPLVRRDPATGEPTGSQPLAGHLYAGVPVALVKEFLREFRFHPDARTVSAPQLLQFLDRLTASQVQTTWSVVIAGGPSIAAGRDSVNLGRGVTVVPVERATKPTVQPRWDDSLRSDTITLGVLASPTDLIADLRDSEVARLRALPSGRVKVDPTEGEHAARSRACKARDEDHCLLVLYAIQAVVVIPDSSKDGDVRTDVELAENSALPIGIAIALPANDKMPQVSYVVNSVLIDDLEQQYEVAEQLEDAS
jgi:hypothetical protein